MIQGSQGSQTPPESPRRFVRPLVTSGPPPAPTSFGRPYELGPLVIGSSQEGVPSADALPEVSPSEKVLAPQASAVEAGEAASAPPSAEEDDLPLLVPWSSESGRPAAPAAGDDLLELEDASLVQPADSDDWADEYELPRLGEATAEDEIALSDASPDTPSEELRFDEAIAAVAGSGGGAGGSGSAVEVAERLERIARTLRERGPKAALAENASDPLGAMIAGYLVGIAGSSGRDEPSAS